WDAHGRAFFGSESSGDPAGTAKTFGDVFVARFRNPDGPDAADTTKDGLEYYGTTVVAKGSSAPNLLGVFHDKTAIEADRTGGADHDVHPERRAGPVVAAAGSDAARQRRPAVRRGNGRTLRPVPRLPRLRRRVHIGLHVLPPRHAGSLDRRPARRGARVDLPG